jgi:hypothetical protein
VAAKATDSSSITDTSPQPLLAPSAAVDPANQPIPGAQHICAHTHARKVSAKFTTRAGRLKRPEQAGMSLASPSARTYPLTRAVGPVRGNPRGGSHLPLDVLLQQDAFAARDDRARHLPLPPARPHDGRRASTMGRTRP